MLTVIKKTGIREPFNEEKVIVSIINAGKDARIQMSHREGELVTQDVKRQLEALRGPDGITSTFEVRSLVRAALREMGFTQVSEMFERGKLHDTTDIERHRQAILEHERALLELTGEPAATEGAIGETEGADGEEDSDKTAHYKSADIY